MDTTSPSRPPMRYADPSRCPACRGPITPGAAACPTCELNLTGELPRQLFATLLSADDLLGRMRAVGHAPAPAPLPPHPTSAPHPRRRRLGAASVPQVLLGLGGLCVLVAALVFLAVAWSVLGVGGRTVVLVALTVVAGGLSAATARRSLRGAAESLAVVAGGLLALDVVGADHAGWFGDLSVPGLLVALGTVLGVVGVGAALAGRRTPTRLVSPEVVASLGVLLASAGVATGSWLPVSPLLLAATLLALVATAIVHRLDLRSATVGTGIVSAGAWVVLASNGLERTLDAGSWRALWMGLEVWPLLAAAVVVAAAAASRRLHPPVRVALAAVAQTLVLVAALAPVLVHGPTVQLLTGAAVLAAAAVATDLLPRAWAFTSVLTQSVLGVALACVVALQSSVALDRAAHAASALWTGSTTGVLSGSSVALPGELPAAWTLPVAVLALLATAWALVVAAGQAHRVTHPVVVAAATLLALGVLGSIALAAVPVWLLLAATLVAALAFAVVWLALGSTASLGAAAVLLAGALALSLHDERLTAAALAVSLVVAVTAHLRTRPAVLAAVAGATTAALLGALVWTVAAIVDAPGPWGALVGLAVLGALVLAAPTAPSRWWRTDGLPFAVLGLEVGAAATALPLLLAGVALAPVSETASWTAGLLTLAGAVVTTVSLLRADRRPLGWVGGVLLAAASWVRLADLGVEAPEAYTLPSAAALLVVGLLHLRRDPQSSTLTALSPGLSLALVPSLLWVLADPTGLRVLLLGLACLALVLGGARLGWTAPILLGATVGLLVVLRLAAPYVGDAVPRWVLLGAAGALLITVGATWERRLQEARQLVGYVRTLR